MPADPRVNVGVAAIVWRSKEFQDHRTDQYLLLLRRASEAAEEPGTYCTPGGWIDHGEDPVTAAIREVYEETGIRTELLYEPLRGVTTHTNKTNGNTVVCLWIELFALDEIPEEPPEPDKCQDVRWVRVNELYDVYFNQLFTPSRLAVEQGII